MNTPENMSKTSKWIRGSKAIAKALKGKRLYIFYPKKGWVEADASHYVTAQSLPEYALFNYGVKA